MKNIHLLAVAAVALALPLVAQAEDGGRATIIKGDKSYQRVQKEEPAPAPQQAAQTEANNAEAAANVEPAAGSEADASMTQEEKEEALHEQMRLPRKSF